jgi:ankyrin repeat protein
MVSFAPKQILRKKRPHDRLMLPKQYSKSRFGISKLALDKFRAVSHTLRHAAQVAGIILIFGVLSTFLSSCARTAADDNASLQAPTIPPQEQPLDQPTVVVEQPTEQPAKELSVQPSAKDPNQGAQPVNNDELNRQLTIAVMQGQEERVKELISQGADINARFVQSRTMLHIAVINGNDKGVLLLLNNGALIDARDENGWTPLHVAAGAGFPRRSRSQNMIKVLLDHGADVNVKDNKGLAPLYYAIARGLEDIAGSLLQYNPDINVTDNNGRTYLHHVSEKGLVDITKYLIDHNADVNASDKQGLAPLHYASLEGHTEIAQLLISRGADINIQDNFGLTPLHHAVAKGYKEMVEILLEHNALVDLQDSAGRTALHFAAGATSLIGRNTGGVYDDSVTKDSIYMVECLLNHGADINIRDKILGWTPLHCAVRIDFYEPIVKLLLERGADSTIMDNRGLVPLAMIPRIVHQQRAHIALPQRIINYKSMADLLRIYTNVYYVSPDGNDSNPGTINNPFRSIHEAIAVVGPGDTIFVRTGTYTLKDTIHLYRSGYAGRRITLKAYPDESPVFDCLYAKDAGIVLEAAYWHIKGLTIINAYSAGIRIEGEGAHHNIIEETTASANQIGGISNIDKAAFNLIVNCDAYKNFSAEMDGGDADGFSMYYGVGEGNVIVGCRSWNNSDDGFDLFYAGNSVRLERCYSFHNGDNIWNYPLFRGDMNGFKLGGGEGRHILINCLSWGHGLTGATMAGNMRGVLINNCTFWDNNTNYFFEWTGWPEEGRKSNVFTNNISFEGKSRDRFHQNARSQSNSWNSELGVVLTDNDFLSLDDSMMTQSRNPDGSIPRNDFLRLAPASAAIDKGTDVGMPFIGARPDLGAFEYDPNETSAGYVKMLHQAVRDHDIKQIEQLLAKGEGINEKDWLGYTPLHWAVYFGYPDLVELLVSKGADPDIQSNTGRYALEIARTMAYPELEVLLRKLGAKAGEVSTDESSQEAKAAKDQKKTKDNVEKVTKADVLRVALKHLEPDKMQILVVGRHDDFDQPLSVLGQVHDIDITIPAP